MRPEEFEAIRRMYPDIPVGCTSLSINVPGPDEILTITCTFYPRQVLERAPAQIRPRPPVDDPGAEMIENHIRRELEEAFAGGSRIGRRIILD